MQRHAVGTFVTLVLGFCMPSPASGEDIFRECFEENANTPPLSHTWGDKPAAVETNAVASGIGPNGSGAARLRATYPAKVQHNLSYWSYRLPQPVPLIEQLESISFQAKTNLPLSIKVGISPFGFIYHGPGVDASEQWQKVELKNAYAELKQWCANGGKSAENGWVSSIIVAVARNSTNGGMPSENR